MVDIGGMEMVKIDENRAKLKKLKNAWRQHLEGGGGGEGDKDGITLGFRLTFR